MTEATNPAIDLANAAVLVVGAGIMGSGIAQVAAQAGHAVLLFDAREGAAAQACGRLRTTFDGLVAKGRMTADAAASTLARIAPIDRLEASRDVGLVVEAIVEDLAVKRALFAQLEAVVAPHCVLATNTSSISVTALAQGLAQPQRLVGMHFFNPVPLMKLVEVVSGLHTDAAVAAAIFELSRRWGKTPVHARSTPGFIVNRIARPYYAEALALLLEQATTPRALDACLRGAGFRMGPCELMDLIGHDTNFAVTRSVFEANFGDRRYQPSLLQREMVDGGLLGRKTGRGFYRYPDDETGQLASPAAAATLAALDDSSIAVHGSGAVADGLAASIGADLARNVDSDWVGVAAGDARLVLSDGRTATEWSARTGVEKIAVFDRPVVQPTLPGTALAFAVPEGASEDWAAQAAAWLARLGFVPLRIADAPGLVVARTIAMLVNEAADAVLQGVCTTEGADAAMKLGVAYPAGPFDWLSGWSAAGIAALVDRLDHHYRGERYRVSPWLRRRAPPPIAQEVNRS